MKVLLVLPPTAEKPSYAEPPAGLLYVGSALKRAGHAVTILDIYRRYIAPNALLELIRKERFDAVGFGGITTCYGYVKEASLLIRKHLPDVRQIAGGVLSSTYDLLLRHTAIDIVCRGEGELTAVNVVNRMAEGAKSFEDIKGIAYSRGGEIIKTHPQPYIEQLDDIPPPDYDLIDMEVYAFDAMQDPFFSIEPSSRGFYQPGMRVFNLKTARGCTNACTFCYRHFAGYRQHSIDYVIRHIRTLQERYNVQFFRFGDELFTRDRAWIMEFTRRLNAENINIHYIVHGVRTDNVDKEMMLALKASGCITVFIGFESGSQKMLTAMRKNVLLETNIQAVKTILESGLHVLVQSVIGMPGETEETIQESIDSLARTGIDPEWISINYAQAYPATGLWQHAIKTGLITDPETYLIELGRSNKVFVNYTDLPKKVTDAWRWKILHSLLKERVRRERRVIHYLQTWGPNFFSFGIIYKQQGLLKALQATIAYLVSAMKQMLSTSRSDR